MKRFITTKTGLAALVGAVVVGVTSFGAYAWFTNSGSATSQTSGAQVTSNNTTTWQIATDPANTTYSNSGTGLVPTPTDSAAAIVATVPFTVTNADAVSEHLDSITVSIN